MININKVKHDNWDRSSDTSLYLQSGINALSACHFTYSPKTQQEQNFRKSLTISCRIKLQLNFLKILYHYIVVWQKFKLILISSIFLLRMISFHALSIALSTLSGGSVLSVLTQFLSNRSQYVLVDGCRVNWSTLCQECRREVVWAVLFLLYT